MDAGECSVERTLVQAVAADDLGARTGGDLLRPAREAAHGVAAFLDRAKKAARYEPRHYPYFNLARIHIKRHEILAAIRELEGALAIEPRYVTARKELHRLRGLLN